MDKIDPYLYADKFENALRKQQKLNEIIYEKANIVSEEERRSVILKQEIAYFVELSEVAQEIPTKFKYWKETAKDNKEKTLEELADAFHFWLSLIMIYYTGSSQEFWNNFVLKYEDVINLKTKERYSYVISNVTQLVDCSLATYEVENNEENFQTILWRCVTGETEKSLLHFPLLVLMLGFTLDDLFEAYDKKYEINLERVKNEY